MEFKNSNNYLNLHEAKAEMLINRLVSPTHPIAITAKGTFYGNYCEEIIRIDNSLPQITQISLARDGIYHLLPENLFFSEDQLLITQKKSIQKKNNTQENRIKEEIQILNQNKTNISHFFQFFDNEYFKSLLDLDLHINDIESNTTNLLLKEILNIDIYDFDNIYIKKILPILLFSSEVRGNMIFIKQILSAIFNCKVKTKMTKNIASFANETHIETSILQIIFIIPKLSNQEYLHHKKSIENFINFFSEWFFPFDLIYECKIKDYSQTFFLGESLTLDYNTQI